MTALDLHERIGQAIAVVGGKTPDKSLSMVEIRELDLIWHELIYEAKGEVCTHPKERVTRDFCFDCQRTVEIVAPKERQHGSRA